MLKLYEVDKDFNNCDNMSILESIETLEDSPIVEHKSRQLMFVGGIKSMIVIDIPLKTVIA